MAFRNIYIFAFLTVLVGVNLIFAEENSLEQSVFDLDEAEVSEDAEREARSPSPSESNEEEPQERLFFGLLGTSYTSCNYTTSPGSTCLSCRIALTCFSTNTGVTRLCRGLLPYCNAGRCSFIPGSLC